MKLNSLLFNDHLFSYNLDIAAAECLPGDGEDGYVNLNSDRLTSKTGAPYWYCDATTVPRFTSKSYDWQGNNKWYRFVGGSGMINRYLFKGYLKYVFL